MNTFTDLGTVVQLMRITLILTIMNLKTKLPEIMIMEVVIATLVQKHVLVKKMNRPITPVKVRISQIK